VAWLLIAATALAAIGQAFKPGPLEGGVPIENPLGFGRAAGALRLMEMVGTAGALAGTLAAVASLFVRLRRSRGVERQQVKWFVYAGVMAALGFVLQFPLQPWPALSAGASVAFAVGFSLVAIAAAMAVLRYRLYDIDLIINRTLVYGALTAALALAYWASVLVLQPLLRPLTQGSELAVAGSTLAVAALFRPLRTRIQAVVDRRFYRRKYDATKTLQAFNARLREEVDLDTLTDELLQVVRETLQPANASLWLRERPREGVGR
jgi:hypothetical protein